MVMGYVSDDGREETRLLHETTTSVKSAVVTGSSGFVGSHLVRRLADDGCLTVGIDLSPARIALPSEIRLVKADIRDTDSIRDVLSEVRPQVIFHLAGQPSPAKSMRDPIADIQLNVVGTVNVASAAASADVGRFVFFSTGGAMYGQPQNIPIDEQTPPSPDSIYGASKLAAEEYLRVLGLETDMQTSVLRPGHIYGPDPRQALNDQYEEDAANFAYRMIRNERITIIGDGNQRFDYVYVDDVVEAAMKAAIMEPATCVIGTGTAPRTLEIFEMVARLTGYERDPIFVGDPTYSYVLDASRARSVWGWEPRVHLGEGIAATVHWFQANVAAP